MTQHQSISKNIISRNESKSEKVSKWNLAGLFKKRSGGVQKPGDIQSELSDRDKARFRGDNSERCVSVTGNTLILPQRNASQQPPPLPPKNTNIFQPTMQVRGQAQLQQDQQQHQTMIFPQLQPDVQYPDPGSKVVQAGYYYDPRQRCKRDFLDNLNPNQGQLTFIFHR